MRQLLLLVAPLEALDGGAHARRIQKARFG